MRLRHIGGWILAIGSIAACSAKGSGGEYMVPDDAPAVDDQPAANDTPAVGCSAPRLMCGSDCVDVSASPINCGACGTRCTAGQSCVAGACQGATTCSAPRRMCGASCTDVSADTNHCGACGNRCNSTQTCTGGVCVGGGSCSPPRTMCDVCTDIQTDSNNCGLCGFRCPTGESCTLGACRPGSSGCSSPRTMCGATCTDISADANNCGSCGNRCLSGQSCSGSRCTTSSGTTSPAGNACTPTGTECGAVLECQSVGARGFCTATCTNGTVTTERAQCGGNGSTCLTQGEGATARSFCTHACTPGARSEATGGCRAGTVCTGWWYTHAMGADDPGCFPFCGANSDCGGMTPVCNVRTGSCSTTGVDNARLPDGSACNPMMTVTVPGEMTPRNVQCRGICFGISSTVMTQGLCGSFLNLAQTTDCRDNPMLVQPRAPAGEDDLGICIFRSCARNTECSAGLVCIYPETMGTPVTTAPRLCQYPTTAQRTGVP